MVEVPSYLKPIQIKTKSTATPIFIGVQQIPDSFKVNETQTKVETQTKPDTIAILQSDQKFSTSYFGKKESRGSIMKKRSKESEKKENVEWDTGFGELYEKIEDRKVKPLFKSMDKILKEEL